MISIPSEDVVDRLTADDRGLTNSRVLIADDQADVLEALRLLLKGEGYKIESVGSPAGILTGSPRSSRRTATPMRRG